MRPTRRFVVEVTMVVDDAGTEQTFLIGSDRWRTKPTDVPANTKVLPYLLSAGTLTQEIWADGRFTGPIRPSYGNIVVMNPQPDPTAPGKLSAWLRYGMAGARIVVRRGVPGDAYPSQYTTVYIAYGYSFVPDGETITIRLRDRTQLFDTQVLDKGFLGTGGLEGNGSVPKLQQFVSFDGFVPPFVVDSIRQIYFVQSTATSSHGTALADPGSLAFRVYENGVEIERGADYTSADELLSVEPAEGTVRFWFGPQSLYWAGNRDGPVYMRIAAPPIGELRVYADGVPNDADIARNGGLVIGSFTYKLLAMRAGVDAADIDGADDPIGHAFVDDSQTYLDLMARSCIAQQSWVGFSRLDRFQSGRMFDPTSETEEYTFTESNSRDLKRLPVPGNEVPAWKVFVKSGRSRPCSINDGADPTIADLLSREWRSTFTGVADATKLKNPGAVSITVELDNGNHPNKFSRDNYLTRLLGFIAGQHDYFTLTVDMNDQVLALGLGSVVKLKSVLFDMAAGQNYMIAGLKLDCDAPVPSVQFWLWGGTPGVYTGPESKIAPTNKTPQYQLGRRVFGAFRRFAYGTTYGPGAIGNRTFGAFRRNSLGTAIPTDPNFANVELLLHGNGNFTDSSPANRTATVVDAITTQSDASAFGGTSIRAFKGGTANYLEFTEGGGFLSSTSQDFTLEGFIQIVDYSTGPNGYADGRCSIIRLTSSGSKVFEVSGASNSTSLIVFAGASYTIPAFGRFHFAISRNGGTMYRYVDGVRQSASVENFNFDTLRVGNCFTDPTNTCGVRVEELRLTVGVGRYTGTTMTVPTAAYPDA